MRALASDEAVWLACLPPYVSTRVEAVQRDLSRGGNGLDTVTVWNSVSKVLEQLASFMSQEDKVSWLSTGVVC